MLGDKDIALLEAYTYGTLDGAAEMRLRDRISSDPDFAGEVRKWELLEREGFRRDPKEESSILEEIKVAEDALAQSSGGTYPTMLYGLVAVLLVAGLLLLGWIMGLFGGSISEGGEASTSVYAELVEGNFEHLPSDYLTLSTAKTPEEKAIEAYENREYSEAIPLLLEVVKNGADSLNLLYAGVAAVGEGEGVKAISILEPMEGWMIREGFGNDHSYYLGLAYLLNDEKTKAETYLSRVQPGSHPSVEQLLLGVKTVE